MIGEFKELRNFSNQDMDKANENWLSLMDKAASALKITSKNHFEIWHKLLHHMMNDQSRIGSILTFDGVPGANPDCSVVECQPYLLLFGQNYEVVKASVVVEKQKIFDLIVPSAFQCFMVLISLFYVFGLQYPRGCKATYSALVNIIVMNKPCKHKKLLSVIE